MLQNKIKIGDLLFYNQSGTVEVGIITNINVDGEVTVINNCTKTNVAPTNFIETSRNISNNLRKSIKTF